MTQMKLHTPHISVCPARDLTQDIKMLFLVHFEIRIARKSKAKFMRYKLFGKTFYERKNMKQVLTKLKKKKNPEFLYKK